MAGFSKVGTKLAKRAEAVQDAVEEAADPAFGAELALRNPPMFVVSDLWMPSISGVQLCLLLRAEPATSELVLVLCGDGDDPRSRFWASRAGANAYVPKRRHRALNNHTMVHCLLGLLRRQWYTMPPHHSADPRIVASRLPLCVQC